jgi:hypothetical protein
MPNTTSAQPHSNTHEGLTAGTGPASERRM